MPTKATLTPEPTEPARPAPNFGVAALDPNVGELLIDMAESMDRIEGHYETYRTSTWGGDPEDESDRWARVARMHQDLVADAMVEAILLAHAATSQTPAHEYEVGSEQQETRKPCGVVAGGKLWLALNPGVFAADLLRPAVDHQGGKMHLYVVDLAHVALAEPWKGGADQ